MSSPKIDSNPDLSHLEKQPPLGTWIPVYQVMLRMGNSSRDLRISQDWPVQNIPGIGLIADCLDARGYGLQLGGQLLAELQAVTKSVWVELKPRTGPRVLSMCLVARIQFGYLCFTHSQVIVR